MSPASLERSEERTTDEISLLVPKKGLEPPHPCGYMDLNHARLPIPPLRQVDYYFARLPCGLPVRKNNSLFYRRFGTCQTSSCGTWKLVTQSGRARKIIGTLAIETGSSSEGNTYNSFKVLRLDRRAQETGHAKYAETSSRDCPPVALPRARFE